MTVGTCATSTITVNISRIYIYFYFGDRHFVSSVTFMSFIVHYVTSVTTASIKVLWLGRRCQTLKMSGWHPVSSIAARCSVGSYVGDLTSTALPSYYGVVTPGTFPWVIDSFPSPSGLSVGCQFAFSSAKTLPSGTRVCGCLEAYSSKQVPATPFFSTSFVSLCSSTTYLPGCSGPF